jgi:hypothetical protein
MANFPEPMPVNIGGWNWYPMRGGTTAEMGYSWEHVVMCGGDPRRVRNTATTLGYGSLDEPQSEAKKQTAIEANRLRYELLTKYGIGKRRTGL